MCTAWKRSYYVNITKNNFLKRLLHLNILLIINILFILIFFFLLSDKYYPFDLFEFLNAFILFIIFFGIKKCTHGMWSVVAEWIMLMASIKIFTAVVGFSPPFSLQTKQKLTPK